MPFVGGGGDCAGSDDIERDRGWTEVVKVSKLMFSRLSLALSPVPFSRQSRNGLAGCVISLI